MQYTQVWSTNDAHTTKPSNMNAQYEIQVKMQESWRQSYTSTSNGYKWVIKHKHMIIKCGSLVVQV